MKNIIVLSVLTLAFIIQPSFALAAPLTNAQAESLIGVVQSSPETPASAFVQLITVFSNITDQQAESLITVVQASPNTPANAFVGLLIAFTVDYVETPVLGALQTEITNLTNQIKIMNEAETPVVPVAITPAPIVAESIEVETLAQKPNGALPLGRYDFNVSVKFTDETVPKGTVVSVEWPSDHDKSIDAGGTSLYSGGSEITTKEASGIRGNQGEYSSRFGPYIPTSTGTKTITFTSGELSKSVSVEVK